MGGCKTAWLAVFSVLLIGSAYYIGSTYYIGSQQAESGDERQVSAGPKNLQEIAKLESEFDRQQIELSNRLADVQNRLKTVKLNLGLSAPDNALHSTEIADRLQQLDDRLLQMKTQGLNSSVPFPSDSPAGKLQNQPRSASGVPLSVLQNYEQETGVSADEIEALMRRTE